MSSTSQHVLFTTSKTPQVFSEKASGEAWCAHHLTTYTGAEKNPIPTDHGAIAKVGKGYRMVLTDGLGHWDPKAIGTVALEVMERALSMSLKEQVAKGKGSYQGFLKGLAIEYKNREGTTLLQLEVETRLKKLGVTLGKCGDSTALIIDERGAVCYSSVDTTHHLKSDKKEIGLLAIGGNFQPEWLNHATYVKTTLKVDKAFAIVASDGLTKSFCQKDGTIDSKRFRYAVLTGKALFVGEKIPKFAPLSLTPEVINAHLRHAAAEFAQREQKERKTLIRKELEEKKVPGQVIEKELKKIHAGDDTTILTVALHKNSLSSSSSSQDPLYRSLIEAYQKKECEGQRLALTALAKRSRTQGNLQDAAHFLNGAASLYPLEQVPPYLFDLLEELETLYLKSLGTVVPTPYGILLYYREKLASIRQYVSIQLASQTPVEEVQKSLTQAHKGILIALIKEGLEIFGKPPTPFMIMGLGSMAREEMCPYSDVEFAIAVKKSSPTIKHYFRTFAKWITFRIINFGETAYRLIKYRKTDRTHIEESLTPQGFSMDSGGLSPLGRPGGHELIGTPEELALYQDPTWLKKHSGEIILANALTQTSFVYGEEKLLQAYTQAINRFLNLKEGATLKFFGGTKQRELRGLDLLRGHLHEFKPTLDEDRIQGRAFGVKQDLYRPLQMAISGLLLYLGFRSCKTLEGIKSLQERGFLNKQGATRLKKALRSLLTLRIQTHLFYQKEQEILYLPKGPKDTSAQGLYLIDNSNALREIYRVLIPLHTAVQSFVQNPQITFKDLFFYDKTLGTLDHSAKEKLQYDKAEASYTLAAALNPNNTATLRHLGQIKQTLGKVNDALIYKQENLRLLKQQHGETPHPGTTTALNELGLAYNDLGESKKAIECSRQALAMGRKLYGTKPHPTISKSLNNLGLAHFASREMEKAIDFYNQALAIDRKLYGNKPHSDIAIRLNNLGSAYQALGKPQKAIDYLNQSLAMGHKIDGNKPHPDIAIRLNNLGSAYQALGKPQKAINSYNHALAIDHKLYGNRPHPQVALRLWNLGTAYYDLKQYGKAKDHLLRAHTMFMKVCGPNHPDTKGVKEWLAKNDSVRTSCSGQRHTPLSDV
ncbi:tetratricopeptide repeat protein [Candidatus Neptunochlamydia vexilliferae]|uniref:Protein-PII uridylyltransferase N-terminal domain-containing protein n=1 Tax=Candidatus Neptunichlamydia vexilliferae TaxID=1651774 RepID=A0ABS0AXA5_9BACT|nr:tetratricopeptide repeat protein [Candidatus Neptunochlamydia vexilliferae]MBF5058769.1 hypothetical protein [Candidatus Neptunochlamydia vexilliferae]